MARPGLLADDPLDSLRVDRDLRASAASVSGSRCVRTSSTSGTASRIASSTCSAMACARSRSRSPGSFRWSETSTRPSTSSTARLWISRTCETPSAAASARSRMLSSPPRGSTWTTTSTSGSRSWRAASTRSAAACPCPTAAPGATPMTTSAKCAPPASRTRSRRSSTGGSSAAIAARASSSASTEARSMRTPTFRPRSRAAATITSAATKSAAIESPAGKPTAAAPRPTRTASVPTRSLPKWSAFACSASLRCSRAARRETCVREASIAMTTAIAANVHTVGSTSNSTAPASRATASPAMTRLTAMRKPASASAARFWAFACPNGWPRSAGRTATETAKNVTSAAARSVPEWAASARSPRLPLAIPATSLIAIRRHAAPTETSAVRRCGDMRGRLRGLPGPTASYPPS